MWLFAACGGGADGDADASADSDAVHDEAGADTGDGDATGGDWYRPPVSATWQWQLQGEVETTFDVSLYDVDMVEVPEAAITALHAAGRKVICYFSAGSWEAYREDASAFDDADLGATLDGWPDERWLDVRSERVRAVMRARLDAAAAKGCDGVEADNVDGYANDNGLGLEAADQLDYNRFLAREAHARGLAIGLKNDLDQIDALVGDFDFAVNEQCHEFDECDALAPFVAGGKPVLVAEYAAVYVDDPVAQAEMCAASRAAGLHTLVLPVELDGRFRISCEP